MTVLPLLTHCARLSYPVTPSPPSPALLSQVTYDLEMDLGEYMCESAPGSGAGTSARARADPQRYSLYGVIVHLDWALSTASGHYVCYVKIGGRWYKCDDASVTPALEDTVLTQTAYMLFYQREAPRDPPTAEEEEEAAEAGRGGRPASVRGPSIQRALAFLGLRRSGPRGVLMAPFSCPAAEGKRCTRSLSTLTSGRRVFAQVVGPPTREAAAAAAAAHGHYSNGAGAVRSGDSLQVHQSRFSVSHADDARKPPQVPLSCSCCSHTMLAHFSRRARSGAVRNRPGRRPGEAGGCR